MNKPQFTELRRAIASDLGRLRASPQLDTIGLSAKLDALIDGLAHWPLSSAHERAARTARAPLRAANLGQELLSDIKSVIQIRRLGASEPVLLPPDQEYFLRENLKLRLLSARLALLAQDQAGFHADVTAAYAALNQYFNTGDAAVGAAASELRRLGSLRIAVEAPDIQASLSALDALKVH
jgi:uncharacterized protein HemX